MEFITPVVTIIIESLMAPVKKHMGFFFSSTKHVENMTKKLSKLNEAKLDMEKKEEDALINDRLTPTSFPRWLEKVKTINRKTENIPTGRNRCKNIKIRYKVGKSSFNILQEIDDLLEEQNKIVWNNKQRPLGMVRSSTGPSTSQIDYDVTQNIFQSRKSIFNDILTSLEHDNKAQKMALWGMGGVGKTTMMEDIKKVVEKKGLFAYVLKLDIGRKYDPITTQKHIANHMGVALTEETKEDRVERLGKSYKEMSKMGKKILFILDDVWEVIDLKDIGLANPFPKGFKLLVTSRFKKVCIGMDIETRSIMEVDRLEEEEAKHLFWKSLGYTSGDGELRMIGEDILKKCGGLPIAIKTIALALRGEGKDAWEVTQKNLQRHKLKEIKDLEYVVYNIFEISYKHLKKEDDKAIFVLCGLFPDDFEISLEELLWFGWGLQLFKNANSLMEARKRIKMSVDNLISANLLTKSYSTGRVKIYNLARDFVLVNISKFKQASIVNHGDKSEWPTQDTHESCERILLTCKGMSEFPKDFYYPNLTLLKLMNGDRLLKFPEDFHKRMEKLQVMAYDKIQYPLSAHSLCYSTNLQTLCLHSCSLVDNDISFLGNLVNLEVLSLAYCGIRKLPSTIKKLKMLKLLDLTKCFDLCIDDDVFQCLGKLEELYMRVSEQKSIRFSDANCDELKQISGKLNALEIEFFKNILQPKNVSFKNLQRFRISMGDFLNEDNEYSFKNTLKLVTNSNDLLECKINELFSQTEELQLSVKDIINVGDITISPTQHSTFSNLKDLHVYECEELTHLFTVYMANGLKKLESLTVSSCPLLKSIVSSCDGVNVIELPQLVTLNLQNLPNFTSIILEDDISSTQPLFNKEVVIPNLSKLIINGLEKLKQIWACDFTSDEEDNISMLKVIEVNDCNSLVNLFPCNPMKILTHLENLRVNKCCSIEVIFNIDLGKIKQDVSNLRSIEVSELDELREMNGISEVDDDLSILAFPSYHLTRAFNQIHRIHFRGIEGAKVLFEIETPLINRELVSAHQQPPLPLLPYLEDLKLENIHNMSHVWKCNNWNKFVILHKHQPQSSFQNLTNIYVYQCNGIKYLFSPRMFKFLSGLKTLYIGACKGMEEVVSNRDDDEVLNTSVTTLFPCLDYLTLDNLSTLKHIGGGVTKCSGVDVVPWSLCQYSTKINILFCPSLSTLIPSISIRQMQKLQELTIKNCKSMVEVFESKEINNIGSTDRGSVTLPRPKTITNLHHQLTNLKKLSISECDLLEYIFTISTLESLRKLEKLKIISCKAMKAIVREEHEEEPSKVVFPRLKSIKFMDLPSLAGFFMGIDFKFEWRSLDYVMIKDCPQMMVFTSGESIAPKLKYIHSWLGKYNPECSLNLRRMPPPSSDSVCPSAQGTPWSFPNIIEMDLNENNEFKKIFPSNELLQLKILEKIFVRYCRNVEEVFEVTKNDSPTVVTFPKLREVELKYLNNLKYIWKSNQWNILEFPNLTRLSIYWCHNLEYVFTTSMVGSLIKLQELDITWCDKLEVIVKKEEEYDGKMSEIMFPSLKFL
ncbi:hypothetical protein E3N88_00523 [Mikania micrantha]|uniref:Uncharacterized protein n=1 Tax=Mikania micrantha TaxID=192012 RepID=A0A5N6PZR9_9ASTR|nr:hypothetical protein E3N88_00523 [Mikania micrantha]